jgi:predicted short-subunit dehydrogenase-like oxidoreductase (DUF2520 family)
MAARAKGKTVSIIGIGRVGGALAIALDRAGYLVKHLVSRDLAKGRTLAKILSSTPQVAGIEALNVLADADVVFITVSDGEIAGVAKKLAKLSRDRAAASAAGFVFHPSGSQGSEVLSPLAEKGFSTGSIHPLFSISDSVTGAEKLSSAYFCVEGSEKASAMAKKIVRDLGGKAFGLQTSAKPLYHAAAVMACGHLTALFSLALEMMKSAGVDERSAQKILVPLAESTLENLGSQPPEKALTGTFARADAETFEKHLQVIKANCSADVLDVYLKLGEVSLGLAEKNGVDKAQLKKMRRMIIKAQN